MANKVLYTFFKKHYKCNEKKCKAHARGNLCVILVTDDKVLQDLFLKFNNYNAYLI